MNNQITLIGRVGQNPTSTTFTESDNKVAKFSLAVADYSSKTDIQSRFGSMSSSGMGLLTGSLRP